MFDGKKSIKVDEQKLQFEYLLYYGINIVEEIGDVDWRYFFKGNVTIHPEYLRLNLKYVRGSALGKEVVMSEATL